MVTSSDLLAEIKRNFTKRNSSISLLELENKIINFAEMHRKEQLSLSGVSILRWKKAELNRPKNGQKIIFYDNVGMFKGLYRNHINGQVLVDFSEKDIIDWDDVSEWTIYPEH